MSDRTGAIRAAFADADLNDPAVAFSYGLAMGRALELERQDALDDALHRTAVRVVTTHIQRADRRAAYDRGSVAA